MMRKLIPTVLLFFTITLTANAQKIRLHVQKMTVLLPDQQSRDGNADFLGIFDIGNLKIHFYAKTESEYVLLKRIDDWTDEKGNSHLKYKAIDQGNEECILEIIKLEKLINIAVDYEYCTIIYKGEITR